jgi:uncharacterized membrane protein
MRRAIANKLHLAEVAALLFLAIAFAGLTLIFGWRRAALGAFAMTSLGYSGAIALFLHGAKAADLPVLAARHDRRAPYVLGGGLSLVFIALFLVLSVLMAPTRVAFDAMLAALAIVGAFVLLNTLYAIHYAHYYFAQRAGGRAPFDFPGECEEVFSDFLYFAFVIGMTFQVSDVTLSDSAIRRLVLQHSIIAFLFNVFVLALAVSAASDLF